MRRGPGALRTWPIGLSDAVAKTAYLPAKLLEETVPQLKKKGRLQAGMDADIVVFDPVTVQDRATYQRPNQTSAGMSHVLVNGTFVIRDGALDTKAFPGRAVRRVLESRSRQVSSTALVCQSLTAALSRGPASDDRGCTSGSWMRAGGRCGRPELT